MSTPIIAVTGANGYVGSLIVDAVKPEARVIGLVRTPNNTQDIKWSFDADPTALAAALREHGVTQLIHAAWDMKENSLAAMERSCVIGSSKLFDAAAAAGIKKPIFISSISAFTGARSAYGRSKLMVEDMVLRRQGVILRLGMVYGKGDGGAFGSLKNVVRKARIVPLIGDGSLPQYLLHEVTLASVIRRAVRGDFNDARQPLSLAQPEPVALRTLLRYIAATQNKRISLVPVPWVLVYLMLKSAETVGLNLNFRSDSLISYVFQDPAPDFGALERYGIEPVRLTTQGAD